MDDTAAAAFAGGLHCGPVVHWSYVVLQGNVQVSAAAPSGTKTLPLKCCLSLQTSAAASTQKQYIHSAPSVNSIHDKCILTVLATTERLCMEPKLGAPDQTLTVYLWKTMASDLFWLLTGRVSRYRCKLLRGQALNTAA